MSKRVPVQAVLRLRTPADPRFGLQVGGRVIALSDAEAHRIADGTAEWQGISPAEEDTPLDVAFESEVVRFDPSQRAQLADVAVEMRHLVAIAHNLEAPLRPPDEHAACSNRVPSVERRREGVRAAVRNWLTRQHPMGCAS